MHIAKSFCSNLAVFMVINQIVLISMSNLNEILHDPKVVENSDLIDAFVNELWFWDYKVRPPLLHQLGRDCSLILISLRPALVVRIVI